MHDNISDRMSAEIRDQERVEIFGAIRSDMKGKYEGNAGLWSLV